MEQNYSLKIQSKDESSVTVRFWSKKNIDLRITDIKFFYNGQAMPKDIVQYVAVLLNNDYRCQTFDCPGQKVSECTSLNFIVKDVTSKTQHALRLPLNGDLPVFTEMLFEGR